MNNIVISAVTVKRLISDIKEVAKNSLSKEGIYYKHDESNMLIGYALIIGPENTPYEYGNFLFKLNFPSDYPHSPPVVTYYTNDGSTRFNPNLYKNGKVCISILNTWKGEQWSGCQTIRTILLSLCSLLNNNPLLNEPGITETHRDIDSYNKIIKYKTLDTAINKILSKELLSDEFKIFYDIIVENYKNNYIKIISDTENNINEIISTRTYNMLIKTNYKLLNESLKILFLKLTDTHLKIEV
tara:strand:+ start:2703 stop:3428 length:726 start_codon:yes stop_codon:yes gene_type:complete